MGKILGYVSKIYKKKFPTGKLRQNEKLRFPFNFQLKIFSLRETSIYRTPIFQIYYIVF